MQPERTTHPNRARGNYWVRYDGRWTIAEWLGACWWHGSEEEGDIFHDADFSEIGAKYEMPGESEKGL